MENLKEQVDRLENALRELKQDRFNNLSSNEVESLKNYIIERTATGISGAVSRYWVTTINGKRGAIPVYDNFVAL